MSSVLHELQQTSPPLRGIVHAAGLQTPQSITEMDLRQFDEVLQPKVTGAWILHKLTASIELDFMISFSGIVTFKKADELRSIAREVPLDHLLIETDCPYLTPVPYRGKRNEPAYVVEVARCLADLHGLGIEKLAHVTAENFMRFFGLQ